MARLFRRESIPTALLLIAALALRAGLVIVKRDSLREDRDGYRAVAESLTGGGGFALVHDPVGETRPTAYRPPLYPLVLSAVLWIGAGDFGIAALQVLLGTLTVLLTYFIGRRLDGEGVALAAAGLVAVDPLLLHYTAFPMTETLCTFLVTLLLALMCGARGDSASPSKLRLTVAGMVFGFCVLCRPTIWVFGLLLAVWWLGKVLRKQRPLSSFVWPAVLAIAVVVAPWMIRNMLVFGRPILSTTHGGYTLLLGNNPVFYREVVTRRWGTAWDDAAPDRTRSAWMAGVVTELEQDLGEEANDESARDRWMYRRAFANIAAEPVLFLRSCGLRFGRFWNVVPLAPARRGMSAAAVWGTGLFYSLVSVAFLFGILQIARSNPSGWLPLLLLIAGFCLVHIFFWSNARMRAPVIPAIALVAAEGLSAVIGVWRRVRQQ